MLDDSLFKSTIKQFDCDFEEELEETLFSKFSIEQHLNLKELKKQTSLDLNQRFASKQDIRLERF